MGGILKKQINSFFSSASLSLLETAAAVTVITPLSCTRKRSKEFSVPNDGMWQRQQPWRGSGWLAVCKVVRAQRAVVTPLTKSDDFCMNIIKLLYSREELMCTCSSPIHIQGALIGGHLRTIFFPSVYRLKSDIFFTFSFLQGRESFIRSDAVGVRGRQPD